jgi:hypothetical protein
VLAFFGIYFIWGLTLEYLIQSMRVSYLVKLIPAIITGTITPGLVIWSFNGVGGQHGLAEVAYDMLPLFFYVAVIMSVAYLILMEALEFKRRLY